MLVSVDQHKRLRDLEHVRRRWRISSMPRLRPMRREGSIVPRFERRLLHHVSVMVARFRSQRLRLAAAKRLSVSEPVQVLVQMGFLAGTTGQSAIIIETGTSTLFS